LLDGNLQAGGRPPRLRLPLQPQPPQRGYVAFAGGGRDRGEPAAAGGSVPDAPADAAGEWVLWGGGGGVIPCTGLRRAGGEERVSSPRLMGRTGESGWLAIQHGGRCNSLLWASCGAFAMARHSQTRTPRSGLPQPRPNGAQSSSEAHS